MILRALLRVALINQSEHFVEASITQGNSESNCTGFSFHIFSRRNLECAKHAVESNTSIYVLRCVCFIIGSVYYWFLLCVHRIIVEELTESSLSKVNERPFFRTLLIQLLMTICVHDSVCTCVCVCECKKRKQRERERDKRGRTGVFERYSKREWWCVP